MNVFKKMIVSATLVAMVGALAPNLAANEDVCDAGKSGYEQCRRIPSLTPAIALGTIAIIAIIAVAVQNSSHHGHVHD
jgi:hypothetical protein